MPCPAESHNLEKFDKKERYEPNSDTTNYRPNGVRIIKAVNLYSNNGKEDKSDSKVKLEKLLGQSIKSSLTDSAWGCKCDKHEEWCESFSGPWGCGCDIERSCECHGHCGCESM